MRKIDVYQIENIALDVTVTNELAEATKRILDTNEAVTSIRVMTLDSDAETVFTCALSRRADYTDRDQLVADLLALGVEE